MKAINTAYKGNYFRSRLEAKWAVYFDVIGVKWQYEPEGFEENGIKYLPDFYFPEYDIWGEVKPEGHNNQDLQKWLMFGNYKTLIIFEGKPHAGICSYYGYMDGLIGVIPFADKLKESYGCLWHAGGDEYFSNTEPYATAIWEANKKRF